MLRDLIGDGGSYAFRCTWLRSSNKHAVGFTQGEGKQYLKKQAGRAERAAAQYEDPEISGEMQALAAASRPSRDREEKGKDRAKTCKIAEWFEMVKR